MLAAACTPPPAGSGDAGFDAGEPDGGLPVCALRAPGQLVITEFLNDPVGVDTGSEWIEIYNPLDAGLELESMVVYAMRGDGSGLKSHAIRSGAVPAGGYFTLGDVRVGPAPWSAYYAYADGLGQLSNTDGIIGVKCRDTVLAELTYTMGATAGRARQLDGRISPGSRATTEADWCNAPDVFAGMNYGSPAAVNPSCP